jgi:hypothetical protein
MQAASLGPRTCPWSLYRRGMRSLNHEALDCMQTTKCMRESAKRHRQKVHFYTLIRFLMLSAAYQSMGACTVWWRIERTVSIPSTPRWSCNTCKMRDVCVLRLCSGDAPYSFTVGKIAAPACVLHALVWSMVSLHADHPHEITNACNTTARRWRHSMVGSTPSRCTMQAA